MFPYKHLSTIHLEVIPPKTWLFRFTMDYWITHQKRGTTPCGIPIQYPVPNKHGDVRTRRRMARERRGAESSVVSMETRFLHTGSFTHRRFYTQTLLHTDAFYTQDTFYTQAFTHRSFYTQTLLHTDPFTHRRFYTQTLLHTEAFTQMLLHTETFTHTDAFTHRSFYTQTLSFRAKGLLRHKKNRNFSSVFDDRPSFRAKRLLQDK